MSSTTYVLGKCRIPYMCSEIKKKSIIIQKQEEYKIL